MFRLSGTGSVGATIRMYIEQYESDSSATFKPSLEALAPLVSFLLLKIQSIFNLKRTSKYSQGICNEFYEVLTSIKTDFLFGVKYITYLFGVKGICMMELTDRQSYSISGEVLGKIGGDNLVSKTNLVAC